MTSNFARTLCWGLAFLFAFSASSALADGWLWNTSSDSKSKTTQVKSTKQEPSTLSKISSGTKKFFTGVGNTLTGKSSTTQKKMPTNTYIKQPKKEESSSGITSWFKKEDDSKKPKTPSDWVAQKRPEM